MFCIINFQVIPDVQTVEAKRKISEKQRKIALPMVTADVRNITALKSTLEFIILIIFLQQHCRNTEEHIKHNRTSVGLEWSGK